MGDGPAGHGGRNTEFLLALAVALGGAREHLGDRRRHRRHRWHGRRRRRDHRPRHAGPRACRRVSIRARCSPAHDSHTLFDAIGDLIRHRTDADQRQRCPRHPDRLRKARWPPAPKLRRRRRTKIIATLGPASSSPEVMARLFQAGADVFRLNFSHGTHEDHAARFAMIRELETRFDRPIGILADVQGPKLRVGHFSGGRVHPADRPATSGSTSTQRQASARASTCRIRRSSRPPRSAARCCWTTASCACASTRKRADALETEVVVGGPLSDRKGVNVPDIVLPIPALTDEGPRRPGVRAGAWRQLHRPFLRAAAGGCGRGEGLIARPCLGDGEAGEASGARQSRRHHGS